MAIEDYYNSTVDFYAPTKGSGPARTSATWIFATTTSCADWQTGGRKTIQIDGKQITVDKTIFVTSVDVPENYRAVIDSKGYEILFKDNPMVRDHHFEYSLKYLPEWTP